MSDNDIVHNLYSLNNALDSKLVAVLDVYMYAKCFVCIYMYHKLQFIKRTSLLGMHSLLSAASKEVNNFFS